MHVFPYSPREGTIAYKRGETVTKEEKHIRSNQLISISNKNKGIYGISNRTDTTRIV